MQYGDSKSMQGIVEIVKKDLSENGCDQDPQTEGLLEN